MKWLNLLAAALAASMMGGVQGAGFEQNGGSCEEADRKSYIVSEYQGSRTESFYGPLDPTTLQVLPTGCVPPSLNVYGAWYKVNFPGSAGLTLDSSAFSKDGIDANQTISVMEGSCAALTCAAYADAVPNGAGGRDAAAIFTLKANTDYFVLYTVANVPGAAVPQVGIKPLNAEAACKWYRSDQITNSPYSGGGLGTCTPCVSETTTDGTTWSTTCSDACQKCYDVGGAPFCYNEQRQWMVYTPNTITVVNPEVMDIDFCYNFTDGNKVCDQGVRDGACPGRGLSVNGVTCSDCVQQYNATTCLNDVNLAYGNFRADCSLVGDGSGVMDKCTNTGFDTSPALYNYAVYTDLVLANLYGQGAYTAEYQGQCAVYTEEGLPVETAAPTASPVLDPAITINMDDRTDEFDVAQDQNVLFTIDVSDSEGIVECEVRGDNGDIDLYVGVDVVPSFTGEFIGCASTLFGSDDKCSVLVDGAFKIHVLANGYRAATEATVKCELTKLSDAREYDVSVDVKKEFSLDAKEYRLYKMEIPDNAARVSCKTSTDDGDLDLWLRISELPQPYVDGRYDCGSNTFTGNEYCELTDYISNNDVYVLLEGWGNVTKGELECVVTLTACSDCLYSDDAEELRLEQRKSGWSLLENENKLYYFRVPRETTKVWCDLRTDDGDVDLYMRVGEVPVPVNDATLEGGIFDCASISPDGNEYCYYEWTENTGSPTDVSVYALVTGYAATRDIRIECDGDVPLTKDDSERIRDNRAYGTNLEKDEEVLVHIEITEGTDELICVTDARRGDVDVFSKKNEVPKRFNGNGQVNKEGAGNVHEIRWEFSGGLDDGAYGDEKIYILLAGFEETRDVELLCEEFYWELIEAQRRKVKRKGNPKVIVSSP